MRNCHQICTVPLKVRIQECSTAIRDNPGLFLNLEPPDALGSYPTQIHELMYIYSIFNNYTYAYVFAQIAMSRMCCEFSYADCLTNVKTYWNRLLH